MNIQYRIVKVDPEAHGVVIRYFTDKVTEMDLANSFNPDGTIKLNADRSEEHTSELQSH